MKKSIGCPADGIEGFRLFMIGQKEKPEEKETIPYDIIKQLAAHHKKSQGASPSKLYTAGFKPLDMMVPRKTGLIGETTNSLNKDASSRQALKNPSAAGLGTS